MSEKSVTCVLIISLDLKRFQHTTDGTDDLLALFIFDHTVVYRNDPVALFLINAGDHISFPVTAKRRMNFISVIIRIFHSDDRFNFTEFFQKAFCNFLFLAKLILIRYSLVTTAAAFLRN